MKTKKIHESETQKFSDETTYFIAAKLWSTAILQFHYTLKDYPQLSTNRILKYSILLSKYSCVGEVRLSSRTYIKTYCNKLFTEQSRIHLPSKLKELWNIKQWSSILFLFYNIKVRFSQNNFVNNSIWWVDLKKNFKFSR